MSILEIATMLLIGGLIGYLVCMISWVKELSNEITMLTIEEAKIKAKLEALNGMEDEE